MLYFFCERRLLAVALSFYIGLYGKISSSYIY
nr:MAG TPA: hypothetical protein [Caudoviricetes sp.]